MLVGLGVGSMQEEREERTPPPVDMVQGGVRRRDEEGAASSPLWGACWVENRNQRKEKTSYTSREPVP